MSNIEDEVVSIGRIDVQEFNSNPDIIRQKVEAKIQELLNKYGFTFVVTEFSWVNGQVQASFDLVEKSKDNLE